MIHPPDAPRLQSFRTRGPCSITGNLYNVTESPPLPRIGNCRAILLLGMKIVAFCDEEQGCPLYRRDNRLEFVPPTVTGVDGIPICSVAIETLQKLATKIAAGELSTGFNHTFCGG